MVSLNTFNFYVFLFSICFKYMNAIEVKTLQEVPVFIEITYSVTAAKQVLLNKLGQNVT